MILGTAPIASIPLGSNVSPTVYSLEGDWITFDGIEKIMTLHVTYASAEDIYAAWLVWSTAPENLAWDQAFVTIGGEMINYSVSIPYYYMLINNWRVRPMEEDHVLIIVGNLCVQGGAMPLVQTLGNFNVLAQYTLPMMAQAINVASNVVVEQLVEAVWAAPVSVMTDTTTIGGFIHKLILTVPKFLGLK
jgi:hypothetical protein